MSEVTINPNQMPDLVIDAVNSSTSTEELMSKLQVIDPLDAIHKGSLSKLQTMLDQNESLADIKKSLQEFVI